MMIARISIIENNNTKISMDFSCVSKDDPNVKDATNMGDNK